MFAILKLTDFLAHYRYIFPIKGLVFDGVLLKKFVWRCNFSHYRPISLFNSKLISLRLIYIVFECNVSTLEIGWQTRWFNDYDSKKCIYFFYEAYLEGRKYLLSCIVLRVETILQSNVSLGSMAVYVATLIILLVYRTINVPQKIL